MLFYFDLPLLSAVKCFLCYANSLFFAHVLVYSYLLANVTHEGFDVANARWSLLGASGSDPSDFTKDLPAFYKTEIFEFSRRLQSSGFCVPHFQAAKVAYAHLLADYGFCEEALK
jgi:hypothetical protein